MPTIEELQATLQQLQAQIAQLQAEQSDQTNAIKAMVEGRLDGGADSVKGWLLALNPSLQVAPAPFAFGA